MTNKTTMCAVALIAAFAMVAIAGATAVDGDPSTFQVGVTDRSDGVLIMTINAEEGSNFNGVYTVTITNLDNVEEKPKTFVTNSMDNENGFFIVGDTWLDESTSYFVTLTSSAGSTMSAVYLGATPAVTISMEGDSDSIDVGTTGELSVATNPEGLIGIADNGNVNWNSSEDGIVQISGGDATGCTVEALKPGTTTITVSFTVCGTEYKDGFELNVNPIHVTSVTIEGDETSIDPGETLTLNATVNPSNASYPDVEWTSSDPSVATVSQEGVVTALAPGEVTITATADGVYGTKVLTVNSIPVQSISIGGDISLSLRETQTLECTFTPANATNRTVTWTSSDNGIVSVSADGTIVAEGIGSATITATTADGSKTDEITVTVSAVEVTGIEIVGAPETLKVGDAPYQLNATVSPANASTKAVSWASSDNTVLSVSSQGIVTVLKASETPVTITATITDEYGDEQTFTYSVQITVLAAEIPTYEVHVDVGTGGTVSPAGDIYGNITVKEGDDLVLTVRADTDYRVSAVMVDGEAATLVDGTYTFTDVTSDHTVSVTFEYMGTDDTPGDIPSYPPFIDDGDDYVPPPTIVYEDDGAGDDNTGVVACAIAAVAAAILAVFLIMEYRKR